MALFYLGFMDDILVHSPTHWRLRKAVKVVNQVIESLRLEKHPDKTFIGPIEKGFDFPGYHFRHEGLSVAEKTVERFLARVRSGFMSESRRSLSAPPLLGLNVKRWLGWM